MIFLRTREWHRNAAKEEEGDFQAQRKHKEKGSRCIYEFQHNKQAEVLVLAIGMVACNEVLQQLDHKVKEEELMSKFQPESKLKAIGVLGARLYIIWVAGLESAGRAEGAPEKQLQH